MKKIIGLGFAGLITIGSFLDEPFQAVKSAWSSQVGFQMAGKVHAIQPGIKVVPSRVLRKVNYRHARAHHVPTVKVTGTTLQNAVAPAYLCRFSGRAISSGHPVANTEIYVWVTTSLGEQRRMVPTAVDGSFALNLMVTARSNEPVDWEIRAHTGEWKASSISGRRILLGENQMVSISQDVELQAI